MTELTRNRLHNLTNPYQGDYKKVLCVCSAGLLRSPTTASVLNQEFNYNTRAAGLTEDYALIYVDDALLLWADQVVCMETYQYHDLEGRLKELGITRDLICLKVPDNYAYNDPKLREIIKRNYEEAMND